jgi:surface protein
MTFISQWKTDNPGGVSANNQIRLPLESSGTYNFTVNWGDNSSDVITTWNQPATTHTYATPGSYTVSITGTIIGFRFANSGDKTKIINISQWGDLRVGNNGSYFHGCSSLNSTASDALNLTGTTTLTNMFDGASTFNGLIGNWDTSNITNMSAMFAQAQSFNQPIGSWNMANVTSTIFMFINATNFNQPLNSWNVSKITSGFWMFFNARSFNQSLNSWNVSNFTNMNNMFQGALNFNGAIGNWNTQNVSDMSGMFAAATNFNQDLSRWCVSLIPSIPPGFDSNTPAWTGGIATRPQWGTCPPRNIPGSVTISGNTVRGETLTATVTDADGIPNNISYQWQSSTDNGISWSNIVGAISFQLALVTDLVGRRVRVTASYTDNLSTSEAIASAPTNVITHINIPGSVTISGNTVRGNTLTATVTDADGIPNNISYQWQSSTDDGISWSNIVGAIDYTLLLTTDLVGRRVRVTASYTDNVSTSEAIASAPTATVTTIEIIGILTITGDHRQYKVLTAIIEDLNGVNESTVTYQWQKSIDGIEWIDITEATIDKLYLKSTYQNHFIRVTSTYQTLGENLIQLTSDRTDLIASPFSILDFVKTNNFYTQSPLVNAVFTLESFPDWIIDTETGNLVPNSTGNNVIICTATVQQKKDPNLVVQSGVDYNRIYFEGYLINPKTLLDVEQGKNITAVINNRQGIFDFVPIIESGQEISLRQREVNGQRIAGYFRLGNLIDR